METIYTVDEAAATLKVDAQTVRRMLQQGRIKGRKLGKAWRIPESALRGAVTVELEPETGNETAAEVDALLDATAAAARRAGYRSDEDIERLIAEVRAELGHDKPRRALREKREHEGQLTSEQKATTGASA
jgi:excisionase family DNA binding protein